MHFYMLMGVSLIKVMLHSFYHKIEDGMTLKEVVEIEKDLALDLDEFYDMDLVVYSFKITYQKIRALAGIEENYQIVKNKLDDLTNNLKIKEERKTGFTVIILAMSTIIASFKDAILDFIWKKLNLNIPNSPQEIINWQFGFFTVEIVIVSALLIVIFCSPIRTRINLIEKIKQHLL